MTAQRERIIVELRDAMFADLEAIREIYNHYVLHSTATFDEQEQTALERRDWYRAHVRENLPVIVAEDAGEVVGWGSLSYYHSRCAYRQTVEWSVYIRPDYISKGIGRQLLRRLITVARQRRYHCMIGLICSENTSSIQLSQALGFDKVGHLREVGRKDGRWLDVTIMEKML